MQKILHFEPPQTIVGAQLNMNFSISLFINRGSASVYDFVEMSLTDRTVLDLAKRAMHEYAPPNREWEVRLIIRDGRVIRAPFRRSNGGTYEPQMLDRRMDKFRSLTRDRLPEITQKQIIEIVERLDSVQDVALWVQQIHKLFGLQKG